MYYYVSVIGERKKQKEMWISTACRNTFFGIGFGRRFGGNSLHRTFLGAQPAAGTGFSCLGLHRDAAVCPVWSVPRKFQLWRAAVFHFANYFFAWNRDFKIRYIGYCIMYVRRLQYRHEPAGLKCLYLYFF